MVDFGLGSLHETDYSAGQVLPLHAHPDPKVSVLLAGSLEERAGARTYRCAPLHAVVKPAGIEHSDHVGEGGAKLFTIRFAADRLPDPELWQPDCYRWHLGGELVRLTIAVLREWQEDGHVTDDGPLDVLAALGGPARSERRAWLSDARELIHAEFDQPLSATRIAGRIGVHPVHLARVFREQYQCSTKEYLHRVRVQESIARMLRGEPLAAIAVEVGFADQPHFQRAFKRVTGMTPRRFREKLTR